MYGRIFSGIQPTGIPHLGNYVGAVKPWITLQHCNDVKPIYCVVDLHSITTPQEIKLRTNVLKTTACLLAAGIDPKKSILFQQSAVPFHSELSWILLCNTHLNKLQGLHAWKQKMVEGARSVPMGILTYPVLMSADILLYKTNSVPVGEDQEQHIEFTREVAYTMNKKYNCDFFVPPTSIVLGQKRIRSLRDPSSKMSKSDSDALSWISIIDEPDVIARKVKKAVTDAEPNITYDPENRLGLANLLDIHSALIDSDPESVSKEYLNLGKGQYKQLLTDILIENLRPIREETNRYLADESYLISILTRGAREAYVIAEKSMSEIRKLIGYSLN